MFLINQNYDKISTNAMLEVKKNINKQLTRVTFNVTGASYFL